MLSLRHPGSARFLLGTEGQHLLQVLEAQFQCVFGTEHLASATVDTNSEEVEVEFYRLLPFCTPQPPSPRCLLKPHPGADDPDILSPQMDPTEALQVLPAHSYTLWSPESTGADQENVSLGRAPSRFQNVLWSFLHLTLHPTLHSHFLGPLYTPELISLFIYSNSLSFGATMTGSAA